MKNRTMTARSKRQPSRKRSASKRGSTPITVAGQFAADWRDRMRFAEAKGSALLDLHDLMGYARAVPMAKSLLASKEEEFPLLELLNSIGRADLSIEALVVKYRDSGLFSPEHVANAQWRLDNLQTKPEGEQEQPLAA